MKLSLFLIGLILSVNHTLHGETSKVEDHFHIQKCTSKIKFPPKEDEAMNVKQGDYTFHVKICHPMVVEGPHFSSPFFWITDRDNELVDIVTVRSLAHPLVWHSVNGYFFAAKNEVLMGFFLEDGFDNLDNGSSGLIFLYNEKKISAWNWSYIRPASEKKGRYIIVDANNEKQAAPVNLLKQIAPVLEHAEVEAGFWPGP